MTSPSFIEQFHVPETDRFPIKLLYMVKDVNEEDVNARNLHRVPKKTYLLVGPHQHKRNNLHFFSIESTIYPTFCPN